MKPKPFRRVAAYAPSAAVGLGLGITSAIFRPRPGISDFDFVLCSDRRGRVETDLGAPVAIDCDTAALAEADLVLVLPGASCTTEQASPRVVEALRAAHARGAIVAAHCLGVFVLAQAGLLDGLHVTTHWQYAADLANQFPRVTVRPEALYIDQDRIATGAGAAAGIDLYLYLIRREHGAALANAIARVLVVPPHRDGGQQQFISLPVPAEDDSQHVAGVITWARANLDKPLSVDMLAGRAYMSRRSFMRHFHAATGASPHAWLVTQRMARAEELLETTTLPVEQIATSVGYTNAAVFREQFTARRGVPPRDYRRTFRHA